MSRWGMLLGLLLALIGAGCGSTASNLPPAHEGLIAYGQTVQANLAEADAAHHWRFIGRFGERIDIAFTSQDNAPSIALLGPDGAVVAGTTDHATAGLALTNIALPTDGTYTIVLTAGADIIPGAYTLTLHQAAVTPQTAAVALSTPTPQPTLAPSATPLPSPLPFGTAVVTGVPALVESGVRLQPRQLIQGRLDAPQESERFTIVGQAGDIITIGMTAAPESDVEPLLTLYGPAGEALATADHSFNTEDAYLIGLTLPVTGAYIIFVEDYSGEQTGAYFLSYAQGHILTEQTQPPPAPDTLHTARLSQPASRDLWPLTLRAGDVINAGAVVDANSTLDPVLSLIGPDGTVLAANDNGGDAGSAVLRQITIPAEGVYQLAVTAATDSPPGPYTLLWQIVPDAPPTALPVPTSSK